MNFGLNEKGECLPCDDPFCYNCYTNHSECISCISGYSFDTDEDSPSYGKCRRGIVPHCRTYGDSYKECAGCESGYFLKHSSKQCIELVCRGNCSKCTDLYDCQTCNEGFGLRSGKCQKCKDDYCGDCAIATNYEKM